MSRYDERLNEYLPWARHFARTCTAKLPGHLDHDNLQSAGMIGYLKAASRYDISRGASFRGFCAVRIRGAVLDELRRWDWAPRSVHKNHRRISSVTRELTEELEREPTQTELAYALGMNPVELESYQMQSQPRQLVSLDEITERQHGDDNLSLIERLPDPNAAAPYAAMFFAEDQGLIRRCLGALPRNQATVISLHYFEEIPLRDVADVLVVSPSRVSQIHHKALDRLRQELHRLRASA